VGKSPITQALTYCAGLRGGVGFWRVGNSFDANQAIGAWEREGRRSIRNYDIINHSRVCLVIKIHSNHIRLLPLEAVHGPYQTTGVS
jgi:hypothetical protein